MTNTIIKDIYADRKIKMASGKYVQKNNAIRLAGSSAYYNHYRSIYVTVDGGIIDVIIGDQAFELHCGDGHREINVFENKAGEIVGLFV